MQKKSANTKSFEYSNIFLPNPEIHFKLKIFAVQNGMAMTEYLLHSF